MLHSFLDMLNHLNSYFSLFSHRFVYDDKRIQFFATSQCSISQVVKVLFKYIKQQIADVDVIGHATKNHKKPFLLNEQSSCDERDKVIQQSEPVPTSVTKNQKSKTIRKKLYDLELDRQQSKVNQLRGGHLNPGGGVNPH